MTINVQSKQAVLGNELFNQWWQRCGSLVLELTPENRQKWLTLISEVIRYHRLALFSNNDDDKQLFNNLCRVSLAKSRIELMNLLVSGYIPLVRMQELYRLENSLEITLE
jgi:hypothetical protein